MCRFLISLVLYLAGIISSTFLFGGSLTILVDIPSLLFSCILPFLFISILFGFNDMKTAFSVALGKDNCNDKLQKSLMFFNSFGKAIWLSGAIGLIINIIGMLNYLEDTTVIGQNFALSLLSIFYSCVTYVTIVLPFSIFTKKQM